MFTYYKDSPEFTDIDTISYQGLRLYKTPSGVLLPSVTTILGAKDKPWLDDWRKMLGDAKAQKETDRCSARGEAVHYMCEQYVGNEELDVIHKDQPRDYIKLFNQIKLALNNKVSNVRAQEVALWNEDIGAAGRVDLIAEYNGVLSVIDFKTSNNNKTEDMVQDYFLQCTAYALMYFYLYGEVIEDIVVIITVEKGIMPLVYKKKIDDYVGPLLSQIKSFNEQKGQIVERANNEEL